MRAAGRRGAGAPPVEACLEIGEAMDLAEELLHPLEERRRERPALVLRGRLEARERLALPRVELLRNFEHDAITGVAVPALTQVRHALAAHAQHLVGLRPRGDLPRGHTAP